MKTFCRILVLGLAAYCAYAQSGAGSIQGTITDATASAIPGASVRVVNNATGVATESTANQTGFYTVPGLFAGAYTVTFSASGMKTSQVAVTLQNAQNVVLNRTLQVGDVAEQVTVNASEIQLVTYDSATVSNHLDRTRLDQLPQNTRNVMRLVTATTPGVESGGQRVNGLMHEGFEYTQDGAPMTNRNFGGARNSDLAQLPDPDAVEEVKIETLNSGAQFATPATAIITTKSGTNQLHGTMFHTMRNNAIGIARARQNPPNFAAPHLVRNEFGVSGGGPIYIPKLYNGKDKSFWFGAWEKFSLRQSVNQLVFVPTVAMRQGDFSNLPNAAGVQFQLYDPNTTDASLARAPFPNNRIPISRIGPLAKALYEATPLPTFSDNPRVRSNITDVNNIMQDIPNFNVRLDHVFDANNRGYARFTHIDQFQQGLRNYPNASPANIAGGGLPAGATGYQQILVTTISAAFGYSKVFSPTFFSETILSRQWMRQYFQGAGDVNQNYEKLLGLPNNFNQSGFPTIGANLIMPYGGSQFNYGMSQMLTNVDENMTRIWGKHTTQFGGRYRHERFGYLPDRSADAVAFSGLATAVYEPATGANYGARANTGFVDADFFLGAASSYSQVRNAPFGNFRKHEVGFYAQDNWRITRSLTVNAGLRWEVHPAPHTRDGINVTFDLKNNAVVLPNPLQFYLDRGYTTPAILTNLDNVGVKFMTPEQAGLPQAGIYDDNFNFMPRLGFAYNIGRWGTVVRGGFGAYIYPVPVRNSMRVAITNLPFRATYSQSYTSAAQSPDGLPNWILRKPLTVIAGQNSASVVNTDQTDALLPGITVQSVDPDYPPANVRQSTLTVEQPVRDGSVFRVTYLYIQSTNLDQNYQYNFGPSAYTWALRSGTALPTGSLASVATRPYDRRTWGNNVMSTKHGFANNSSFQFNYQRPLKNGYAYQIFYVLSNGFRIGGNTFRDSVLYPPEAFAPGILPADLNTGTLLEPSKDLNRFLHYRTDTGIPKHRVTFNGVVDLPFGRGKKFLRNSNRWLDALVGGFQVAYIGNVVSQFVTPSVNNWGSTNEIKVYKDGIPVTDCRSGVCRQANLWFNGYIAPNQINNPNRGVTGLPDDYVPYQTPINNTPGQPNYGTNNVSVRLANGNNLLTAYNPGPIGVNPFWKTNFLGPFNYITDMSLYKVFSITERWKLRFNVDAFNAFNIQGNVNPNNLDGIQQFLNSYWTPRQVQFTLRLSF
ncbi:MAG: carboxypeptidase regulatory-like domain-containing protein [Acidobacteria bacterium]|nr:carboxypeptidase regulatory-like domain-containing protein [Acidobacteriota bacterium]